MVLPENTDRRALGDGNLPIARTLCAAQDLEEGRLPRAICADDAVSLSRIELERDALEERLVAEVLRQVGYRDHGARRLSGDAGTAPFSTLPGADATFSDHGSSRRREVSAETEEEPQSRSGDRRRNWILLVGLGLLAAALVNYFGSLVPPTFVPLPMKPLKNVASPCEPNVDPRRHEHCRQKNSLKAPGCT